MFKTLERQTESIHPSSKSTHYPKLQQVSLPHVESFNSIFDLQGGALLDRAVQDIGKITVFDSAI
jgi:DNA-directed RNA polymerase I subunit RPA2